MALRLYTDSRTLVEVVCACDPVVAEANDREALVRYVATGDLSALVVPDGASRVTIRPLTSRANEAATASAGVLGKPVFDLLDRIRKGEVDADNLSAEDGATFERYVMWKARRDFALCRYGIEAVSDFPGVTAAEIGGLRMYPTDLLDRLPGEAITELAKHIERISTVSAEGKA